MADKPINLTWTKGLSEADALVLQEQFNANYHLFERLQEILDDRISEIRRERITKSCFETAAWSEYQAHLNGKEASLIELQTLITLK